MSRMPAIFLGHGSPTNALDNNEFTQSWVNIGQNIPTPRAIICISGHWCTRGTAVTAMQTPRTIHDFGGFGAALNSLQYPTKGSPELAQQVAEILSPTNVILDQSWGLDHGAWSVLVHLFPDANIPVVQLSMDISLSPKAHFEIANKLTKLRDEGVLILASGNIVHNLSVMDWNINSTPYPWAVDFHEYICQSIEKDEPENILKAESLGKIFGKCHPSDDHFMPIYYFLGSRHPEDQVKLYTPKVIHKSLSMASFVFS